MRSSGFSAASTWPLERSPITHERPMIEGGCGAAAWQRTQKSRVRHRTTLRISTHHEEGLEAELALDPLGDGAGVILAAIRPDMQAPQVADRQDLDRFLEFRKLAGDPAPEAFGIVARAEGADLQVDGGRLL